MGCATSTYGNHEALLQAYSVSTGFEPYSAPYLLRMIKERASAKLLLPSHFYSLRLALSLNSRDSDRILLSRLYEPLWRTSEDYKARLETTCPRLALSLCETVTAMEVDDLLVMGILLSSSNPTEKAMCLFEVYDEGCSGVLEVNAIRALLEQLFDLAVDRLPGLLRPEKKSEELGKYVMKSMETRTKAVATALQIVLKTSLSVTLQGFIARFALFRSGCLTSPSGLRHFAHNLPSVPTPS